MQRIPPVDDESDPVLHETYEQIRQTRGHVSGILRSHGHAPEGLKCYAALGEYVRYRADVPPRTRELVILSIARGNQYAWSHHSGPAGRSGVTQAEMDAINQGVRPDSLSQAEHAAIGYAQAYAQGGKVGDQVFADLRAHWSISQVVDLTLMTGYYQSLGATITAFQLELEPNFPATMKTTDDVSR